MAGDWLKLEFSTPEKPEVWEIAGKTGLDPDAVLGKLFRVWVWFNEQSENGNVASVTPETLTKRIETLTGTQGFATAMREVGWLNGTSIPNFDRHNGKSAKTRALTYSRVKRFRNARETNVTPQRTETESRGSSPSPVGSASLVPLPPSPEKQKPTATALEYARASADEPDPIFGNGLGFLVRKGVKERAARGFLGLLRKEVGDLVAVELLAVAERDDLSDPLSWLRKAAQERRKGPAGKQGELEARNAEVVRRFAEGSVDA